MRSLRLVGIIGPWRRNDRSVMARPLLRCVRARSQSAGHARTDRSGRRLNSGHREQISILQSVLAKDDNQRESSESGLTPSGIAHAPGPKRSPRWDRAFQTSTIFLGTGSILRILIRSLQFFQLKRPTRRLEFAYKVDNWPRELAIHGSNESSTDRIKLDCSFPAKAGDISRSETQVMIFLDIAVDQFSESRNPVLFGHIGRAPVLALMKTVSGQFSETAMIKLGIRS